MTDKRSYVASGIKKIVSEALKPLDQIYV